MELENHILQGDALEVLRTLPDESINLCVTSPPYYGLRDYGTVGQIGLEAAPDAYISRLIEIFREVRRALRPDGTLWLNIADSYAGSGKGADGRDKAHRPKSKHRYLFTPENPAARMPKTWEGIKPKDMLGIPWMLAFALRADGWYLRSDIIWHKPNAMPQSVTDRPGNAHEHLFLLSKSQRYFFNYRALEVPAAANSTHNSSTPAAGIVRKRRGRDVWSIPTSPYRGGHFAAYPVELIKPCILAGCPADGIVLDPFFGSGTTGIAAVATGRRYLGIELNPDYVRLAKERLVKADLCTEPER